MPRLNRLFVPVLLAAIPIALLALPMARAAGDDDYLRSIQEEGKKLEALNPVRQEPPPSESQNQKATTASHNLDSAAFEQLLNHEAPATFKLYNGLSAEKRKAVYESYLRDGKIATAKRKIVELHLGN